MSHGNATQVCTYIISLLSDAEDDHIAFSSDEELMEALGCLQDGILKIYIKGDFFDRNLLFGVCKR